MLTAKKERMKRLIVSIDDILKLGENKMDFTVFSKAEIGDMFEAMIRNMSESMRDTAIKEFGGIEQWKVLHGRLNSFRGGINYSKTAC